jgi:hypothetical protein
MLRRTWRAWKRLGRRIGDAQARLLLTVCYFVVVAPFGLLVRFAGDPLALRAGAPRGWRVRPPTSETPLARALRQS